MELHHACFSVPKNCLLLMLSWIVFMTDRRRSAVGSTDEIKRSTFLLMLRSDLNRALSKAFVLSILGTMLCVLFGAFSETANRYLW